MKILGLSFDYHDSAAAIVLDGKVIAAAQEERFSRKKHDSSYPEQAISFCLEAARTKRKDIDVVVFYEKPLLKFARIINATLLNNPNSIEYLDRTFKSWLMDRKFEVKDRIIDDLRVPNEKIHFIEHHQAHAGSAFFCSPFDKSTIVTIDGVGEYETFTVSVGEAQKIEKLYSCNLPNSIGLFYSAFTAFLGFKVNGGEYKVMGMAGFGKPVYADLLRKLIDLKPDGLFEIKQDCFNFSYSENLPYNEKLVELLGEPRIPESSFDIGNPSAPFEPGSVQEMSRHYADIAASVQLVTEESISHLVKTAVKNTAIQDVSMAGGVALNSTANGRLQRELAGHLYVHPAAGDSGAAIGAALYYGHCLANVPRTGTLENVYLGKAYSDTDIEETLRREHITTYEKFYNNNDLINRVAEKLSEGAIVGWFQGRFEWGPRALGARSILADPTRADMQSIVNEKIKFREPFRPFAPAVLVERAKEYFDVPEPYSLACPEHFMSTISYVLKNKRSIIPAVTHVDGTARVQLVQKKTNPLFYDLINTFEKIKGVPVILNTSFNLRGEPIVNSPWDALKTFSFSGMDYVVLNKFIVKKEKITWE